MSGGETIGGEAAADRTAIRSLLEAAFGGVEEADLVEKLRRDRDLVLGLVARRDGAVTGYAGFCRLALEPAAGGPLAALAPLAVRPECQRQGVGTRLVEAGLARLRRSGLAAVFVLGAPAYYGRFGFRADLGAEFDCPWPGPEFQALALDRSRMPAGGTLVYPRGFAAFG